VWESGTLGLSYSRHARAWLQCQFNNPPLLRYRSPYSHLRRFHLPIVARRRARVQGGKTRRLRWDNACSETLFSSLKVERLHGQHFQTIREAKDETMAWLLWYNRTRMHSTLNYVSPMQFEQDWTDAVEEKIAA
jgi:hypothetical protein